MRSPNLIFLILGLAIGLMAMYIILPIVPKDKEEVSHTALVEGIERIGNLEVVKYKVKDIIEYKKIRQWLPNAKTALIVSGEITVCVDLTQVRESDIQTFGDTISLTLPQPVICHTSISHSDSKIYNMEFGLWESEQVADGAYRQAELYLKEQALKLEYKDRAYENSVSLLTPLLRAMGFNHVIISFKTENQPQ